MRAEVKIGILICLAVGLLVAVYFAATQEGVTSPPAGDSPDSNSLADANEPAPAPRVALQIPRPRTVTVTPPRPVARPAVRPIAIEPAPKAPAATQPAPKASATTQPAPKAPATTQPAGKKVAVRFTPTGRPATQPVAKAVQPRKPSKPHDGTSAVPKTYTVVAGDKGGFWTIASKVYGDGRYWYHIAKANRRLDSRTLRPGQVLIIPPLPKTVGQGKSKKTTGETLTVLPTGVREYVIKPGDNFSTLAVKYLGAAKYADRITAANPGVDPTRLRPGQKVLIPPAPAPVKKPARPAGGVAGGTRYTITDGDVLVTLAAKYYGGDASLHEAILKANPGLTAERLPVGKTIRIPSKAEAIKLVGRHAKTPSAPTGVVGGSDGKPRFD